MHGAMNASHVFFLTRGRIHDGIFNVHQFVPVVVCIFCDHEGFFFASLLGCNTQRMAQNTGRQNKCLMRHQKHWYRRRLVVVSGSVISANNYLIGRLFAWHQGDFFQLQLWWITIFLSPTYIWLTEKVVIKILRNIQSMLIIRPSYGQIYKRHGWVHGLKKSIGYLTKSPPPP